MTMGPIDIMIAVLTALTVDAVVGDPGFLWNRFAHPVALVGRLIDWFDNRLNTENKSVFHRRMAGIGTTIAIVAVSAACGYGLQRALMMLPDPFGAAAIGVAGSVLISQNGLYRHVADVRDALVADGLAAAHAAVSRIVGRDPDRLDQSGVSRAAIESLAENFSDGIVVPAFWFALFGLPGIAAYKAINTADSMIGHRSEKHRAFGWAAARLDDLVNFIPARACLLIIVMAGWAQFGAAAARRAVRVAFQDASKHRSPNAGWPESAFAGCLNIAISGPRHYPGETVRDPYVNAAGKHDLSAEDLSDALHLFVGACFVHAAIYGLALAGLLIGAHMS